MPAPRIPSSVELGPHTPHLFLQLPEKLLLLLLAEFGDLRLGQRRLALARLLTVLLLLQHHLQLLLALCRLWLRGLPATEELAQVVGELLLSGGQLLLAAEVEAALHLVEGLGSGGLGLAGLVVDLLAELLLQLLVEPLLLELSGRLGVLLGLAWRLLGLLRRLDLHLPLHLLGDGLDQLGIDVDDLTRRDALPMLEKLLLEVLLYLLMHQLLDQSGLILLADVAGRVRRWVLSRLLLLDEAVVCGLLLVAAALQELQAALGVLSLLECAAAEALRVLRLLELAERVAEVVLCLAWSARELLLLQQVAEKLRPVVQ